MRWPFLGTLCLVVAIGISAQSQNKSTIVPDDPPDANPQYFPKIALGGPSGLDDFKARWYAKHLRAMGEPSISSASKDKSLVVYRFLWLRTFHHPIAIRFTIRRDGNASVVAKMTNGRGGYDPGHLLQSTTMEISKDQVEQFSLLLQEAGFWTSQTGNTEAGLDGAEWILEGVKGGAYRVIDRWSPHDDAYAKVCLYLLKLSTIKVDPKEIY